MSHPLDPAFAKIKRAETHIKDLNREISAFFRRDPYHLISEVDVQANEEVWSLKVNRIPDEVEAIAADAVHNLRMPLDKMLTVGAIEATLRQIKFPTGVDKASFKRSLANQKKHLPAAVIEFLDLTEAYPRGKGALLFALHDIDNGDKHHPIVVPVNLGITARNLGSIHVLRGNLIRMGSRRGKHMVPAPEARPGNWDMIQAETALAPILRQGRSERDCWLEFTGPHDDMEVLTTTVGAKVNAKVKAALNIAFSEIQGFEGEPIVGVLHQMRDLVHETLVAFRDRFF